MRPQQIKQALQNTAFNSISMQGFFNSSGGLFFLDDQQIEPTPEELNALYSEQMSHELSAFNEFDSNYFYQL